MCLQGLAQVLNKHVHSLFVGKIYSWLEDWSVSLQFIFENLFSHDIGKHDKSGGSDWWNGWARFGGRLIVNQEFVNKNKNKQIEKQKTFEQNDHKNVKINGC